MHDFEASLKRTTMSSRPLSDFLEAAGREPYRDFVRSRIKLLSAKELQDASTDEWETLLGALTGGSPDLDRIGVFIGVTSALKQELLVDRNFWNANCERAVPMILKVARAEPKLRMVMPGGDFSEDPRAERISVGVVMATTDMFAALASESRSARKYMGVRKGLFG